MPELTPQQQANIAAEARYRTFLDTGLDYSHSIAAQQTDLTAALDSRPFDEHLLGMMDALEIIKRYDDAGLPVRELVDAYQAPLRRQALIDMGVAIYNGEHGSDSAKNLDIREREKTLITLGNEFVRRRDRLNSRTQMSRLEEELTEGGQHNSDFARRVLQSAQRI